MDWLPVPREFAARLKAQQIKEITATNAVSARHGLALTAAQAAEILDERSRILREHGRVDIGTRVTQRLILSFSPSPFVRQEEYPALLHDLHEIFYYLKNETEDTLGDDELITRLKEAYENECRGDIELLKGKVAAGIVARFRWEQKTVNAWGNEAKNR
ncbi:MAG: DUF6323 family protein [bacterium]|jgi:hypothetical protein